MTRKVNKFMSIIKSHDITLYGKVKGYAITLSPLCDEHLSVLYKWNADPEVLYWTDGYNETEAATVEPVGRVHGIYGHVSKNAYCFLIKADDIPIGDCWLQEMNFPEVTAHYPNCDVRRIDAAIGEKDWWNKGVGTAVIGMLTDFAFINEKADVIFNFVGDYNERSKKICEKNGYKATTSVVFDDAEENKGYHCVLTKEDYKERFEILKKYQAFLKAQRERK
jgi:RimJ/RimL family protein N-acetyltransferase